MASRARQRCTADGVDVAATLVNVSAGGRIDHLPGSCSYARIVIRLERGERWFCSEAQARAAGWRRAR